MKTIKFFFSFLFLTSLSTYSQDNNTIVLNLSSDMLDEEFFQEKKIEITNTDDVSISGHYESQISVLIKPDSTHTIVITPASNSFYSTRTMGGGGGTTIKSNGGGTGYTPPPPGPEGPYTFSIYPNPVQTTLNFQIQGQQINAYEIYNLSNVLVMSSSFSPTNQGTINVSQLSPNNYILRLITVGNQYIATQFIKN